MRRLAGAAMSSRQLSDAPHPSMRPILFLRNCTESYLLEHAIAAEQLLADVNNQCRYVLDRDNVVHEVRPDPTSPYHPDRTVFL